MRKYTSFDLIEWGQPFERRINKLRVPEGSEVLVRVTAAYATLTCIFKRAIWIWVRRGALHLLSEVPAYQ